MRMTILFVVVAGLSAGSPALPGQLPPVATETLRRAVAAAEAALPAEEARWRESLRAAAAGGDATFRELLGYEPPGGALALAQGFALLHGRERRGEDARKAAAFLARYTEYRQDFPADAAARRIEYRNGLPAVPSFFHLADYADVWRRIRGVEGIDAAARAAIEDAIAGSAEFTTVFPEWGPHNRAILRAECLIQAARALPAHAGAARWRKLAAIIAEDSRESFGIEDAALYQPVWLLALLRWAEAAGDTRIFEALPVRATLRSWVRLLTPAGNLPDFGDSWWNSSLDRIFLGLAWGAAALRDGEMLWAARRVLEAMGPPASDPPPLARLLLLARAAEHAAPDLAPAAPDPRSGLAGDDLTSKKIVFRSGFGPDDFYLLLNFQDEGDAGWLARRNLRRSLAVAEEKMHHGHSDENAIVLLMDGGSVLLHDAGYRDAAPSGPFGAYRADLFHDRLVARAGAPRDGQTLLEFLRNDGRYRPVRTHLVDFARFGLGDYGRTRLVDAELGVTADRTIVCLREPRLAVVVDTVRADRAGEFTFAPLWAAAEVLASGPGFAVTATPRIGDHPLPRTRDLLLLFPDRARAEPGRFPLRRHRQEETVLSQSWSGAIEAGAIRSFVTVLWPVVPGAGPEAFRDRAWIREVSDDRSAVAIEIVDGAATTTVLVKTDLDRGLRAEDVRPWIDPVAARISVAGLVTDGGFALVRRTAGAVAWAATDLTHLILDGTTVFEAGSCQFFQPTGRSDRVGQARWRRWEDSLDR